MALIKCVTLLVLATVASAQYGGHGHVGYAPVAVAVAAHQEDYYAPPQYEYEYAVNDAHTHDIKQQKESRHGDRTEGVYSFLEADGTTRTVKYFVDGKSGFVAQVIREGHAVHAAPVQKVAVAPVVAKYVAPVVATKFVAPVAVATGHANSFQTQNVVRGNYGGYGYGGNQGGFGGARYGGYGGNFGSGFGAGRGSYGGNFNAGYGGARAGGYGGATSFISGGNFGSYGNQGGYGNAGGYGNQGGFGGYHG